MKDIHSDLYDYLLQDIRRLKREIDALKQAQAPTTDDSYGEFNAYVAKSCGPGHRPLGANNRVLDPNEGFENYANGHIFASKAKPGKKPRARGSLRSHPGRGKKANVSRARGVRACPR